MNIQCPHCSQQLESTPELAGQNVSCPSCQGVFQIPIPAAMLIHDQPSPSVLSSLILPSDMPLPCVDEIQKIEAEQELAERRKEYMAGETARKKQKSVGGCFTIFALVFFLFSIIVSIIIDKRGEDIFMSIVFGAFWAIIIILIGRGVVFLMKK